MSRHSATTQSAILPCGRHKLGVCQVHRVVSYTSNQSLVARQGHAGSFSRLHNMQGRPNHDFGGSFEESRELLKAQPWYVTLRMQRAPSQECKDYMAECCKSEPRPAKLEAMLQRVQATEYPFIPAQSAGWRHLCHSFFTTDDNIWNLAGLSCLPSRKQHGVAAPGFYRPERLTGALTTWCLWEPSTPLGSVWLIAVQVVPSPSVCAKPGTEQNSLSKWLKDEITCRGMPVYVVADRGAFAVAVCAARGDLQDALDVHGMVTHKVGDPDPDQVQAAQFAHDFDVAKRGFALKTAFEALRSTSEAPHDSRLAETGLHCCYRPHECVA
jgi:hypothetical protein